MRGSYAWVAAAALAVACQPAPPAPRRAEGPTPARTLYQFKLAYNMPDAALAEEMLSRDFVRRPFPPPAGFPAGWDYDAEVAATRAMLKGAYHVVLEFVATDEAVGKPASRATTFVSLPLDTRLRVWRNPNYCFYVRGDVVYSLARARPGDRWKITGVEDCTTACERDVRPNAETELTTWSRVMTYYLRESKRTGGEP